MSTEKIYNPATKRYVKIDGKIGRKLVAEKDTLIKSIKSQCHNDADPITMDNFDDVSLQQLQNMVKIGKGNKKHCYLLESIYEHYKTAVMSRKTVKDPMDPSHELTMEEISDINKKMKAIDSKYKPPVYESPKPYSQGLDLVIEISPRNNSYFSIRVTKNNRLKFDLGVVPGWVETSHTGSADYTSGVLLSNLRELWERRLFLNERLACSVTLNRYFSYWTGSHWRTRFIALCEQVKALLDS